MIIATFNPIQPWTHNSILSFSSSNFMLFFTDRSFLCFTQVSVSSIIVLFMTPILIGVIEIVIPFFSILKYNVIKIEALSYSPFIPTDVRYSILLIVITQKHLLNKFSTHSCILFINIKLHKLCLYNLQTLICTNYNCKRS